MDLFSQNIKLLTPYFEDGLKSLLIELGPSALDTYQFDQGDNEVLNLKFNGEYFYPTNVGDFCRAQMEQYSKEPNRIVFDERAGLQREHNHYLPLTMGECISKIIADESFSYVSEGKLNDVMVGYGVAFGLGLGLHIERYVNDYLFKDLIVCETNVELLSASLSLVDWTQIVEKIDARNGRIHFCVSDNAEYLNLAVLSIMKFYNYELIEGSYLLAHHSQGIVPELIEKFNESKSQLLSYNGWIEDELIHLENIIGNISENGEEALLSFDQSLVIDRPVIIVGSGPSLSSYLEDLKEISEKFCIISSGTSLRILLRADIIPDFHCELENVELTYEALKQTSEEFSFSNITLLASYTVNPKITEFFNSTIFFPREGEGVASIMRGQIKCIPSSGRTATLSALAMAIHWKAKHIFLMGLDFAMDYDGSTHAQNTIYESDQIKFGNGSGRKEDIHKVQGNFQEYVISTGLWTFMRHGVETAIAEISDQSIQVFNCSDGAKIEGAIPCDVRELIGAADALSEKTNIGSKIHLSYLSFPIKELKFETNWKDLFSEVFNTALAFEKYSKETTISECPVALGHKWEQFLSALFRPEFKTFGAKFHAVLSGSLLPIYHYIHFKKLRISSTSVAQYDEHISKIFAELACQLVLTVIHRFQIEIDKLQIDFNLEDEMKKVNPAALELYKESRLKSCDGNNVLLADVHAIKNASNAKKRFLQFVLVKKLFASGCENELFDNFNKLEISCAICASKNISTFFVVQELQGLLRSKCDVCEHVFQYLPYEEKSVFYASHKRHYKQAYAPIGQDEFDTLLRHKMIQTALLGYPEASFASLLEINPRSIAAFEAHHNSLARNNRIFAMPICPLDQEIYASKNLNQANVLPYFTEKSTTSTDVPSTQKFIAVFADGIFDFLSDPCLLLDQIAQIIDEGGVIFGRCFAQFSHVGSQNQHFSEKSIQRFFERQFTNVKMKSIRDLFDEVKERSLMEMHRVNERDLFFVAYKRSGE